MAGKVEVTHYHPLQSQPVGKKAQTEAAGRVGVLAGERVRGKLGEDHIVEVEGGHIVKVEVEVV